MAKSKLLLLAFIAVSFGSFGQIDNCGAGAPVLTIGASCTTTSYDITGFNNDGPAMCTGTSYRDGWFQFTPGAGITSVNIDGTMNRGMGIAVYSVSCAGSQVGCTNPATGTASLTVAVTPGTVYYLRISRTNNSTNNATSGTICVYVPPPPSGCTSNTTLYPSGTFTPACVGTPETITTAGYATEYSQVNVVSGTTYIFESDIATDFLTIANGAGGAPVYAAGTTPVSWTATLTGMVRFYNNTNSSCGTNTTIRTRTVQCGTPPTPPANDNCAAAIALTVNPNQLCGTVTAGTILASTASPDANTCGGTDDDDVWFKFVATGSTHTIDLLNVTGSTTDLYHAVFTGTCGSLGAPLLCSDPNNSIIGGLTAGTTYYVRVYSWTATTGQTTSFNICIGTPPPPPANDNCAGAISLTVNPDFMCGTVTAGTITSSTASPDANTCGGTDDDDVWFKFVATGTSHTVDLLNVAGSTTDLYHAVFTGTCGSLGAPLICSDPNNSTLTGLTAGTTYYVRVYSWTATTGQTATFNVCIGTPPPPPANDNCAAAVTLTVNPDLLCGTTTAGSIASATASPDANSCGGTDDDDVWYKFVATSTSHEIDLLNVIGSTTDLYHAVYSGACGSLGTAILCSDPNSSSLTGLTVGATYYVRVYSWTSTAGQTSSYSICVGTPPPNGACGNPMNNDYCSNPAVLTYNPGSSWTSSTSSLFSSDIPANLGGIFCGSIENNSWYKFTATATSHTFSFSNITNCNNNWGVQAQVYNVTTNGSLCCTNFASVSNCYNPGTNTPGTVTASGLTIGNDYYLMVDGNAGDDCDFSVSNWSASGILPIELTSFEGYPVGNSNFLKWTTSSEVNNDYFTLEKSTDGIRFEKLAEVDGAGNSSSMINYSKHDHNPASGVNYYRLKQTDFDGRRSYSSVVTIRNNINECSVSNVYPNPTTNDLNFDFTSRKGGYVHVEIMDYTGRVVIDELQKVEEGKSTVNTQMSYLAKGVYSLRVTFSDGDFSSITKVIKY